MNRDVFFSYVRSAPFGGRISTSQFAGLTAILDKWDNSTFTDVRWLAYMLATVFHETNAKMQPVVENLNYTTAARIREVWPSRFPTLVSAQPFVKNAKALANKVYNGQMGNREGSNDGWDYRGRGLPQLTGRNMYAKFGIAGNPEWALEPKRSIDILFRGMIEGLYTGRKLSQYFNATTDDRIGARAIVNGKDKAALIAGYHRNILDAIQAAIKAAETGKVPATVEPQDSKPDDIVPAKSGSLWSAVLGLFGGGGVATGQIIGSVNNIWAFLAVLMLIGGAGVLIWLIMSGRLQILRPQAVARMVEPTPEAAP